MKSRRLEPLTQGFVNKLTPPARRTFMRDPGMKGLAIDLVPTGAITYVFRCSENGRRRHIRIGCVRAIKLSEARMKALELRRLVCLGEPLTPAREPLKAAQTYGTYLEERYLPHIQITHRGYETELSYIRRHLLPTFGEIPITEIRRAQIVSWVESLRAKGFKPGTVNRALNLFKASMTKAVEWEIEGLTESPARTVKPLADHARVERFLTPEEGQRLLDVVRQSANPMLYPVIGLLLLTGARKSEALNLKWEHIDFERRLWTVPLSKSGKPRHIPLSEGALRLLEQARDVASRYRVAGPYAFPNVETGKPLKDINHAWDTARKASGLAKVRLHDLRHSYASALVNEGRSIYEVQKLLGHANISTTERYAHLSQQTLAEGAAKVDEHFAIK
jgi:integrase